jgi:hypothetical protein
MNTQRQIDQRRRVLALSTAAVFALVAEAASLDCTDATTARVARAGEFTGEITPDGPVYRLPPIHVVVDRKVELARIEREEQLARAREVRAKTLRKPSA